MRMGIDLLSTDDGGGSDFEPVPDLLISDAAIPPAARRAIIVERAGGASFKSIALRYDCSVHTIRSIWQKFIDTTVGVRTLADEDQVTFKRGIRRKAVQAIENGLDCDRDPYRQGALGVQVMKGIGEFKSDQPDVGARVNILIGSVPGDWKQRYIGTGTGNKGQSNDDNR